VKTRAVSFGQSDAGAGDASAEQRRGQPIIFIVLGSSRGYPRAGFPQLAKHNGAKLVIVNASRSPLDKWPISSCPKRSAIRWARRSG